MLSLAVAALVGWLLLLAQPWQPWRTRERLEAEASSPEDRDELADITVLIPARNEADTIARTLAGVRAQGTFAKVIVIDDESDDGTGAIASAAGVDNLTVLAGTTPRAGVSGKLWALTQGLAEVDSDRVLLLDADIELDPGLIVALARRQREEQLGLISLMVHLSMATRWERLLIPAFIYFFKLLYPFALANSGHRLVAAAAGGCILTTRDALRDIGGFEAIAGALIDDCTLARRIKDSGRRTWLGLTRSARSARPYTGLGEIWNMVARTAFTQLQYSWLLLALCTALMALYFLVPVAALAGALLGAQQVAMVGAAALVAMAASYLPTIRYYRLGLLWTLALPIVGALYLAMTWTSAWRYARGERSRWKARVYDRGNQPS